MSLETKEERGEQESGDDVQLSPVRSAGVEQLSARATTAKAMATSKGPDTTTHYCRLLQNSPRPLNKRKATTTAPPAPALSPTNRTVLEMTILFLSGGSLSLSLSLSLSPRLKHEVSFFFCSLLSPNGNTELARGDVLSSLALVVYRGGRDEMR